MAADVHYFGIRHHGPGSARRLRRALEALRPAIVLIEGPADADGLLPALADPQMRPPVALLTYAVDAPAVASFFPFAEFSPEYQAIRWAANASVPVNFIDLPSTLRLSPLLQAHQERGADETQAGVVDSEPQEIAHPSSESESESETEIESDSNAGTSAASPAAGLEPALVADPFAALAAAAGYQDQEAWWNDWIESLGSTEPVNQELTTDPVFAAVAEVMMALRDVTPETDAQEHQREAYMRLAIAAAARKATGPVAVICGAWHVPALRAPHKVSEDRARLSGLPKCKVQMTWVPWTSPRLAVASGYGAGVQAPRWYTHLWRHGTGEASLARWMVRVARILRDGGLPVSTASVIEAARLGTALASLRGRPTPGFEEMRDASIACLCDGQDVVWRQHEQVLLLGNEVGEIPPDTPLMPLLEDLQRQQKRIRLKPEALERELALDLRSDAGAQRSVVLHRLLLLDVPWGRLTERGGSRGTFRERWVLAWQPEFAVRLVEQLVYGNTLEHAATRRCIEQMHKQPQLIGLADLVHACMEAQLSAAVDAGLALLTERAALAQDNLELLGTLPGLVSLQRYGSAREMPLAQLAELVERLATQAALGLTYAVRNLDAQQAGAFGRALAATHQSLPLAGLTDDTMGLWWHALQGVSEHEQTSPYIAGLSCRLRYEADRLDGDALQNQMRRLLSPGTPTAHAAGFFDGFFSQAAQRLLHDDGLLHLVDDWLASLDPDVFIQQLPLFRRVFSALDLHERRRLLERTERGAAAVRPSVQIAAHLYDEWLAQQPRVLALLQGEQVTWPI